MLPVKWAIDLTTDIQQVHETIQKNKWSQYELICVEPNEGLERIVKTISVPTLILNRNVVLPDDMINYTLSVINNLNNWDIVYLDEKITDNNFSFAPILSSKCSTNAYVLNKKGAEKMLKGEELFSFIVKSKAKPQYKITIDGTKYDITI